MYLVNIRACHHRIFSSENLNENPAKFIILMKDTVYYAISVDFGSRVTKYGISRIGEDGSIINSLTYSTETKFAIDEKNVEEVVDSERFFKIKSRKTGEFFDIECNESGSRSKNEYERIFEAVRDAIEHGIDSPFLFGTCGDRGSERTAYTSFKNTLFMNNPRKSPLDSNTVFLNGFVRRKFVFNDGKECYITDILAAKYFLSYIIFIVLEEYEKMTDSNSVLLNIVFTYPSIGQYRSRYEEMIRDIISEYYANEPVKNEYITKRLLFNTEPGSSILEYRFGNTLDESKASTQRILY